MSAMEAMESVVCVKNEVFVYNIPARTTNRGYRAADWNLEKPDWTGRMRIVVKGKDLSVRLEDKTTGELFARCPVDAYPGIAVEQVLDSSRYFVIRIQDDNGRSAFIGLGFADRGDSFDLLVAIQDHFKWVKREEKESMEASKPIDAGPKLDLGFKAGQTIKLNIQTKKSGDGEEASPKTRPKAHGTVGFGGFLPPPPGSKQTAQQQGVSPVSQPAANVLLPRNPTAPASKNSMPTSNVDFLLDLSPMPVAPQTKSTGGAVGDSLSSWGEFASAVDSNADKKASKPASDSWIQF